jgi:adenylate kinase family enzyme
MSSIDSVYLELDSSHPKLVFLNGKTSTGKTTLSSELQARYDCAVVELDEVVYKLECPEGKNRFIEAYQMRDDAVFTNSFVESVRSEIRDALRNHDFVIIEGAIVNIETLKEIINEWSDSFLFIYLDIKNIDVYIRRLTSRFVLSTKDDGNGLPSLFWDKFSAEILEDYYNKREMTPAIDAAIKDYAVDSIKASEVRLASFSSKFDHILTVEV